LSSFVSSLQTLDTVASALQITERRAAAVASAEAPAISGFDREVLGLIQELTGKQASMGVAVESLSSRSRSSAGADGAGADAGGARSSAASLTGDWDFADVPYVDVTSRSFFSSPSPFLFSFFFLFSLSLSLARSQRYVDGTAGGISMLAKTERRVELCSAHRQKELREALLLMQSQRTVPPNLAESLAANRRMMQQEANRRALRTSEARAESRRCAQICRTLQQEAISEGGVWQTLVDGAAAGTEAAASDDSRSHWKLSSREDATRGRYQFERLWEFDPHDGTPVSVLFYSFFLLLFFFSLLYSLFYSLFLSFFLAHLYSFRPHEGCAHGDDHGVESGGAAAALAFPSALIQRKSSSSALPAFVAAALAPPLPPRDGGDADSADSADSGDEEEEEGGAGGDCEGRAKAQPEWRAIAEAVEEGWIAPALAPGERVLYTCACTYVAAAGALEGRLSVTTKALHYCSKDVVVGGVQTPADADAAAAEAKALGAVKGTAERVSCLLSTVTFYANHAHNLTRSP
jgi:hypothetical protein